MNPFAILGLASFATEEEIKEAYRRLSKLHHPDRTGGDKTIQQQLNKAYAYYKKNGAKGNWAQPFGTYDASEIEQAANRAEKLWGAGAHAFWRAYLYER